MQLMSAMHTDIIEVKTDVAELKTSVNRLEEHAINTDKKIDRLVKHALKTDKSIEILTESVSILDKRTEPIEKQTLTIGIELKEENKALDTRVSNLEKEVFPEITH